MKRNAKFAVIFIALSFVIPLTVFEIFLRLRGINATYTEKLSLSGYHSPYQIQIPSGWLNVYEPGSKHEFKRSEFTHVVNANSIGCNDIEWPVQKKKKRIVCMGDSFTEGVGAPHDSSYPANLSRLLKDSFDVFNAGVSGSDPFFSYMLLKQKLLRYKPDILLMSINQTDIIDCMVRGGSERFSDDNTLKYNKAPWWDFFYGKLFTVRYLMHNVLHYNALLITPEDELRKKALAKLQLINCVDSIVALCKANDIQPVFVFHPMQIEVEKEQLECQMVLDYCLKMNLNTVNVLSYFLAHGLNGSTLKVYNWPADGHHNSTGYGMLAQAIADGMLNQ